MGDAGGHGGPGDRAQELDRLRERQADLADTMAARAEEHAAIIDQRPDGAFRDAAVWEREVAASERRNAARLRRGVTFGLEPPPRSPSGMGPSPVRNRTAESVRHDARWVRQRAAALRGEAGRLADRARSLALTSERLVRDWVRRGPT